MYVVNQSKVNCWRQCRRAYQYRYVELLVPKITARPFEFGGIVHRMIEEHAQGRNWEAVLDQIAIDKEKLFTAEIEMYGEIIEDIRIIMREYFAYWQPRDLRFIPIPDGEDERYAEHEFAIPLTPKIMFKGQIDGIGRTPNKLQWLIEHKTFDHLPSDDHRWRNLQSVVYIYAIKEQGWLSRIDGVCWNYIRSKPPTRPKILKSGNLSQASGIVTLPSMAKKTLEENGLKPENHPKLMARADECRSEYFQRIFTPVNETVFQNIFNGFVDTAQEMLKNHGRKTDMNISRACEWCKYEPICRADLTGGDVPFVKEREYREEDPEAHRRTARKPSAG